VSGHALQETWQCGGDGAGWLALQGIRYMFCDRLMDGIGLFRRDVLGDLRIVADMVFDEF